MKLPLGAILSCIFTSEKWKETVFPWNMTMENRSFLDACPMENGWAWWMFISLALCFKKTSWIYKPTFSMALGVQSYTRWGGCSYLSCDLHRFCNICIHVYLFSMVNRTFGWLVYLELSLLFDAFERSILNHTLIVAGQMLDPNRISPIIHQLKWTFNNYKHLRYGCFQK